MATVAPDSANDFAVANPIPNAAPVIRTTWFSNEMFVKNFLRVVVCVDPTVARASEAALALLRGLLRSCGKISDRDGAYPIRARFHHAALNGSRVRNGVLLEMRTPRRITDPDRARRLQEFFGDAFHDYIAARVLFRSGLPKQAAILSSTAIEKCFKAILAFNGNQSHGHLKTAHFNAVQNFDRELFEKLDLEFLKLNQKAYQLRYTDSVPVDFNLILASREFLAELDYTVFEIFRRFTVERNGKTQQLALTAAVDRADPRVIEENHILTGTDKTEFINASSQVVYEMRNDPKIGIIEVMYEASATSEWKRLGFLREGLVPN